MMKYDNRIVLFLDILGFKSMINNTFIEKIDLEENIGLLYTYLDDIRNFVKTELEGKRKTTQITQFSDSIIISFLENDEGMVFHLLRTIQMLIMRVANNGIICRGAISYGKLVHTQNIIFGPALNNAYKTESTTAIYPRVILDSSVIEIGKKYASQSSVIEDNSLFNKDINIFLNIDSDDKYYIDYFPEEIFSIAKYGRLGGVKEYLTNLRTIIQTGMKINQPDIQVKYGWMKNKYNNLIDSLRDEKNIYRLSKRETGLFDFVNGLESLK